MKNKKLVLLKGVGLTLNFRQGIKMKRVIFAIAMTLVVISFATAFAAETTIEGRIYGTWSMYMTDSVFAEGGKHVDHKGFTKFSLDRSYVTVKSKLSDYVSLAITTDLRDTKDENFGKFLGYMIILKYGYFDWKLNFAPDLMTLRFGLQSSKYMEFSDNTIWGRRYIEKAPGDLRGFLTTSDLGTNLNFNIGKDAKWGTAGVALWNGTTYTDLQEKNKSKDLSLHAIVKPLINNPDFDKTMVGAQIYLGTQNMYFDTAETSSDYKHQVISFGGKFNYKNYFDVGLDYWMNTLGKQYVKTATDTTDLKQTTLSLNASFYLKSVVDEKSALRTLDIFFRYDMYDPNTDSDAGKNNRNYLILGVECTPIKGIASSINYKSESYENSAYKSQNWVYLNTEFRF